MARAFALLLALAALVGATALPARAAAIPEIEITGPTEALPGTDAQLVVRLVNAGDVQGVSVFLDTIVPEGGRDGDPDTTEDGPRLNGVAFPNTLTEGGDYRADRAGRIVHPFLRTAGRPEVIEAEPGALLWTAVDRWRPTLSPGQTTEVAVTVRIGKEAPTGEPVTVRIRAGFGLGDPFSPGGAPAVGEFAEFTITPVAFDLDGALGTLASDLVLSDPSAEHALSPSDVERLQGDLRDAATPVFLAALPSRAGQPDAVLQRIRDAIGLDGTYAALVGESLVIDSTEVPATALEEIRADALATYTVENPAGLLADVARDVERYVLTPPPAPPEPRPVAPPAPAGPGEARPDVEAPAPFTVPTIEIDTGPPLAIFLIPALIALAGLAAVGQRYVRKVRGMHALAKEVRSEAEDDLQALGNDIADLVTDVESPGVAEGVRQDYADAVARYDEATQRLRAARTPKELQRVAETIADGRWAMACTKARLAGKEPPARRPPCFFDPRHGPSDSDAMWAPDGGVARSIPVCGACATELSDGRSPHVRMVLVGGEQVPYWSSPALGYYGGAFGSKELLGTLAVLQALGDAALHTSARQHRDVTVITRASDDD